MINDASFIELGVSTNCFDVGVGSSDAFDPPTKKKQTKKSSHGCRLQLSSTTAFSFAASIGLLVISLPVAAARNPTNAEVAEYTMIILVYLGMNKLFGEYVSIRLLSIVAYYYGRYTTTATATTIRSWFNTTTLYHQTDPAAASAIISSQRMRRGAGGMAGGGIYFAVSKADTHRKAQKHGVILEADVTLGRILTISANGDSSITYRKLKSMGYDSVKIPRPNGIEHVVYDWTQVKNIKVRESG